MIKHILNRGVDKRILFLDSKDHLRFIHNLFFFNDEEVAETSSYLFNTKIVQGEKFYKEQRELLVDVLAFCLMPNHYHILVRERREGAIADFMHKVNMGYSKYFNAKYKRKGTLYEGPYKTVEVKNQSHFIHIPYYIHLNPLDMEFIEWRNRELIKKKEALQFLDRYKWSSHIDYTGRKNFPAVTQRSFLLEVFGGESQYKKDVTKWIQEIDTMYMENQLE